MLNTIKMVLLILLLAGCGETAARQPDLVEWCGLLSELDPENIPNETLDRIPLVAPDEVADASLKVTSRFRAYLVEASDAAESDELLVAFNALAADTEYRQATLELLEFERDNCATP